MELPLIDLCPMLKKSSGVVVKVVDPGGWMPIMVLNHLHPPFDNSKIHRAIWPALDQRVFIDSVIGDQSELGATPTGFFTPSLPIASRAGTDIFDGSRDLAFARKMIEESGYNNEPLLLMAPSDRPVLGQVTQVAREMFQTMGLKVDHQVMDWGSVVTRRANKSAPGQGGWGAFITVASAQTDSGPGTAPPMRGNGTKGWFGWTTDERLEALRASWFDAPDLAAQKSIAEQVQRQAMESVPYVPLGQLFQPTAFRSDIKDNVRSSFPVFWGVRRG